MQINVLQKKISIFILVLFMILMNNQYIHRTYASSLYFYNFSTESNQNYTGKQVIYTYNSRELPLSYPGILIDGTALADYEELFVQELGLQAERNGDVITFSDGTTELVLTLESKNVLINGVADTMSVAPVKLKFDDSVKYYVPTRFVAEVFGFGYVWVSNSSTVRITKTFSLSENNNNFNYNGTLYAADYQNQRIFTDMPTIYYNGVVMAPVKQIFESAGCLYQKQENSIVITKNELSLSMELNSKIAYINGKKIISNSVPMQIMDCNSGKTALYASLEFIADMLGFEITYTESDRCFHLKEKEFTGCIELYPELRYDLKEQVHSEIITTPEGTSPQKLYFEWIAPETTDTDKKQLSKVRAYSTENADVVELYGVTRADINDFFDGGMVVFELKNVQANMETQFFSDESLPHITFALLTELNDNTKLFFIVPIEDEWHFVEQKDCVKVYFSGADLNQEDLQITSNSSQITNLQEPECKYPDNQLIIPMPETVEISDVSDEDIYLKRKFIIKIKGNYSEFYEQNNIINPYYYVEKIDIYYDAINDVTEISFTTKSICGYQYSLEQNYLSVIVGRPNEIYSKIIVLDAGHGGIDPGAIKKGIYEKNLNFTILNKYTKALFEKSDVKVYFTRESDVKIDLYDRAAVASEIGADMFISLHMNSNNSAAVNGTQVYYSLDNNNTLENGLSSYKLAKLFANNISNSINTKNRGATKSDFVVVKYNTVPAVLIELGFMTNTSDLAKLTNTEYQKKAAESIYQTVLQVYNDYLFR